MSVIGTVCVTPPLVAVIVKLYVCWLNEPTQHVHANVQKAKSKSITPILSIIYSS